MSDRHFIDTNIIVYSFHGDNSKSIAARNIIKRGLSDQTGVISYQVVQEFINVATKKFAVPLTHKDCKTYCEKILFPMCQIYSSQELYIKALDISERWRYSFYDSLIITTALETNCRFLYSEDFQHDQKIYSLTIKNPFL